MKSRAQDPPTHIKRVFGLYHAVNAIYSRSAKEPVAPATDNSNGGRKIAESSLFPSFVEGLRHSSLAAVPKPDHGGGVQSAGDQVNKVMLTKPKSRENDQNEENGRENRTHFPASCKVEDEQGR